MDSRDRLHKKSRQHLDIVTRFRPVPATPKLPKKRAEAWK
jgi:hypothetical protein